MQASARAPYGSWRSPITADALSGGTINLGQLEHDGPDLYWCEGRPLEGGRVVIVRAGRDGRIHDLTPAGFNARTRVHEYGGGAFTVEDGMVYFSNFADGRLYRQESGGEPYPITPEVPGSTLRYADLHVDRARGRLICVREDHTVPGQEAVNSLVSLDLQGAGDVRVLAAGNDFYSSPALSPDGAHLAWLTWHHPNMPWDGTELWLADVLPDGQLANPRLLAGGESESIFQPQWSPDGNLYFVSDRTGWWNLYRRDGDHDMAIAPRAAEFGVPQWLLRQSTYAFASPGQLWCAYEAEGRARLASIDLATGDLTPLEVPYTAFRYLRAGPGWVAFVGSSPAVLSALVRVDLATQAAQVLRLGSALQIDAGYISEPEALEFPTEGGLTAYAYFYPPRNRDFLAPAGERPPLIVKSHGGPTSKAQATLNLAIQYWTSRGFAVVDVDYGGSTGYGRAYRERLNGQWGVVDMQDCVNAARHLAGQGRVDGERLIITGGSAGGYTTLCALTFSDAFRAGASHFGIGDLETLARDTHKFESRYSDRLVGPYPARADLYRARSPIHFADRITCPLIVLQGLDDRVVPPSQAEQLVAGLRARNLPFAYLAFPGEGHGFVRAENIKRAIEAELYFYSRVFGFSLAEDVAPVPIENLPAQ